MKGKIKFKTILKKKKWIFIPTAVLAIILVSGGIILMNRNQKIKTMAVGIASQNAQAAKGDISTTVIGTGNLEHSSEENVYLPSEVEIAEVLVESGDHVEKGQVLAKLDAASVTNLMLSIQEELEELDEELEEAKDDTESESITTKISGTVKKIYAKEGVAVSKTMEEYGALLLLAVDGKEEEVAITGVTGTVSSIKVSENEEVSSGKTLLTLTEVQASAEYQKLISKRKKLTEQLKTLLELSGTNTLTADFVGIVQSVNISENTTAGSGDSSSNSSTSQSVGSGSGTVIGTRTSAVTEKSTTKSQSVFTYTSTGKSAKTSGSESETVKTTEKVLIHQITDLVTAPMTGNTAQTEIQAEQCSGSIEWKVGESAFNGIFGEAVVYTAKVTLSTAEGYAFATDESLHISQYNSSSIDWDVTEETLNITIVFAATEITTCSLSITTPTAGQAPQTMIDATPTYTGTISWSPSVAVFQAGTQYVASITLQTRNNLCFAKENGLNITLNGAAVSGASVSSDQTTLTMTLVYQIGEDGKGKETENNNSGNENSQDNTKTNNQTSTQNTNSQNSGQTGTSQEGNALSGGNVSGVSTSGVSSLTGSSSSSENASSESASTDTSKITAMTISPEEDMLLSVSVDELDILSIQLGQKADITFEAIEDETFEGIITSISDSASVNGGVAKYTVEISLAKSEDMRVGMNASATIIVEDKQDILLIPVSALQERGESTFVYTQADEESGMLSGEVKVETGLSDGSSVEIISGLSEGDTVYYTRLASTDSIDSMQGMFGNNMGGGGMPSGERPSGSGGGMPFGGPSGM